MAKFPSRLILELLRFACGSRDGMLEEGCMTRGNGTNSLSKGERGHPGIGMRKLNG